MNIHSYLARVYYTSELESKSTNEIIQLSSVPGLKLTSEDEATISIVTKGRVDKLRRSRRITEVVATREENKGKVNRVIALREFQSKIENELAELLNSLINCIDNSFLSKATGEPARILFLKMKSDYCRYLSEMQKIQVSRVEAAYKAAYDAAKASLGPAHPLRTGIALNFSVFYYEIVQNKNEAVKIAKLAYDEGIAAEKTLPEDEKEDSMELLNVLSTTLQKWA